MTTTPEPQTETDAIHTHFGLSYANYLVLPRTFLQSMPDQWQTQFVALLDQLHEAFAHVPQAECYEVTAGTEHIVGEMSDDQLKQAGVEADWYRGETPPEGLSREELAEWEEAHEDPEGPAYSRNGEELDSHFRVLIPGRDPVPHYNRGRTRIEPSVVIAANEIELDGGDVMLQELSVGDPIEIDKQAGPLRPGCWVITAFEAEDRSRARVRRLSREEIAAARRREASGRIYG